MSPEEFRAFLAEKGQEHWRDMPWRSDTRPYYVLVSELMLQQTQVSRVIPKFEAFISAFPDERALADATLADVLILWQGLGYNRRAKYLHDSAQLVQSEFGGSFPQTAEELQKLPGVGKNTTGALLAYAYNQPALFIETNIRTVYIHHYFSDNSAVDDREITALLAETIDSEHPREFYWALMDYGAWLKNNGVQTNAKSRHYKKQSALKGSLREMRGRILKSLAAHELNDAELIDTVMADERYEQALAGLVQDGLIQQVDSRWRLTR